MKEARCDGRGVPLAVFAPLWVLGLAALPPLIVVWSCRDLSDYFMNIKQRMRDDAHESVQKLYKLDALRKLV